jgi:hypothetical protein
MPERYEVGRFGLRTFKVHGGKLHSVVAQGSGQHWDKGECRARCVVFEDNAFATDAEWRKGQYEVMKDLVLGLGDADDATPTKLDLQRMLEHDAPDSDCRCGIYASLNLENLRRQYAEALFMVAVIAAEGKTIIGTRGLRTEYARIVAYWIPWYQFYMKKVAARECSDAMFYKNLNEMLADYQIPRKADGKVEPIRNASTWWTA